MTINDPGLQDLHARLETLRTRLHQLDLPAARERLRRAENERDRVGNDLCVGTEARIERDKAVQEFKAARGALKQREDEEQSLKVDIARLDGMLNGEKLVEEALAELATADANVAGAEQRIQGCEQALARVEAMIEQEKRGVAAARAQAAQQLLDALNLGEEAARLPPQSAGANLETLELTKASAQQQLEVARVALRDANRRRSEVIRKINHARSGIAVRALHIARAAYVQALASCMVAHWRANREQFGEADPRSEAIAVAQRLTAAA